MRARWQSENAHGRRFQSYWIDREKRLHCQRCHSPFNRPHSRHNQKEKKAFCEDPKQNSDDYGYTFYDGLWSLMKERGITKKELISKSGINYEEFGLMERNADLTLSAIRKICLALNVDYKNVISLVYPSE